MEKILSISVAAYNAEAWLSRSLDSMLLPGIVDSIEIIIVNDGSTDGTLCIARRYAEEYPQTVVVIDKANGGHGSTINASKRIAKGRYFKVVDSDDWVDGKGFLSLLQYLEYAEESAVFSPYKVFLAETGEYLIENYWIDDKQAKTEEDVYKSIKLSMHSICVKTSLIQKMPDLDEHCFYVDVEYLIYSISQSTSFRFLDEPVYIYYIGREGQSVNPEVMFERRSQHFKVCDSIVNYYSTWDVTNNKLYDVIHNRIIALLVKHYKLLFINEDVKKGREEMINFDYWLKSKSLPLYPDVVSPNQLFTKYLKVLRIIHFHCHSVLNKILKNRVKMSIRNSY